MPNIKPISEMKNYTSIVNELSYGNRIYFTKNGHGSCALVDMKELDELDNLKAKLQLLTKLNEFFPCLNIHSTIKSIFVDVISVYAKA